MHECSDTMLALIKVDRDTAREGSIRRCTLMDPMLFFYLVAVAETPWSETPASS